MIKYVWETIAYFLRAMCLMSDLDLMIFMAMVGREFKAAGLL
jgi:hypothetical protein